jgi:hypothetical protein
VFVVDESTDQEFMRQTMQEAWRELKDRSPNRRMSAGEVFLAQLTRGDTTKNLFFGLCAAARPNPIQTDSAASKSRINEREFFW